jgi:hypothetical protein
VLQNINGVLARITEKITPPSLPLPQGEEKRRIMILTTNSGKIRA